MTVRMWPSVAVGFLIHRMNNTCRLNSETLAKTMLRMLLIGILTGSALSACSSSATRMPAPTDGPISLSTNTSVPFTATPGLPSTSAPLLAQPAGIQYLSVAEALADLKTKAGVSIQVMQGWTIVTEADGLTNWSFPPVDHPAYPAVAKRFFYRDQDGWHLKMDILCEAETAACEEFKRHFDELNVPIYRLTELQQEP